MPSAGELLRSERLKRSKNLTEIANDTCISRRYLEAIEADNVADLPGDFFYKAFIRQYAKALGLDAPTTEHILSSAVPVSEPDPLPVLSEVYERAQKSESTRWRPPTGVAVAVLAVVLAGGSGLYAWWQRVQARAETAQATAPPPVQESTPSPVAQTPPPAAQETAPTTPAPTAPAADSGATPPAAAVPPAATEPTPVPAGAVALEIAASEPAWVQVSSEGKTVFIGILEASSNRTFAVGQTAKVLTGNAGGIDVRVNGRAVGAIGPKGQVRTVLITPEGGQVVAPAPKPAPVETKPKLLQDIVQ